ncbi:MAG: hypothetical protein ABJZ75_06195 [Luteolibacter sp.]
MFETMAGEENPRPGGQVKTWHRCIFDYLREFRVTEGSTELAPLVFGVETALWPTAAKKAGKWYRGILEAAERFMVRWHEAEAELSRQRRASAVGGVQGMGGWAATRGVAENPTKGMRRGGGTGGVEGKLQ